MPRHSELAQTSLDAARTDFYAAHFRTAAQRLHDILDRQPDAVDASLLLARVEIRRGNPSAALSVLSRPVSSRRRAARAEHALLRGIAFARLGDAQSSRAQFRLSDSLLTGRDELRSELTYQIAAMHWMERRLDRAAKVLERLPKTLTADVELHVQILRGAIASAGERLHEQGALLLEALRRLRPVDVYLYALLVTQIAALAVELPSSELWNAALTHADRVPWTADIADLHFHTARAIAWRHVLEGDEFNAFRRLKEALDATTSAAWRVAALTDRAYLATALGERRWAAQELSDAHELASTIDWSSVRGEEKLALPVLADLFADRDPSVAIGYVATFKNLDSDFPRILSSRRDRRVEALEAYSLGRVQLALREPAEAKRLLLRAHEIYAKLGIEWRAGRASLALAQIENEASWRNAAERELRAYPRSWLWRSRSGSGTPAAAPAAPASRPLTAAQRAVLDLLLEGRGTEEIAQALGRSTYTVRNHIKAIFKAFGVNSRPALILKAKRGQQV